MRTSSSARAAFLLVICAAACTLTAASAPVPAGASQVSSPPAGSSPARASQVPSPPAGSRPAGAAAQAGLSPAQQDYLQLAQAGIARAKLRFGDRRRGWYDARLGDRDRYPLATIWDILPLFQSIDAIAVAQPSPANKRAVRRFAAGAERYLNKGLRPLPGYSPYPGDRTAATETWFDDNGWLGIAFMNAYRATGSRRYRADAQRALRYIAAVGWDGREGGIWWNTHHPYKAGEAL